MYSNGQTLVHKKTKRLARLVPSPAHIWAWDISKKTTFIAEDGTEFVDDIKNYTHIEDELGRPYSKQPKEGQFVDESAKKYLVSKKKMAEMRQKRFEKWEAEILDRMAGNVKTHCTRIVNNKPERYSLDSSRRSVLDPFADGSKSLLFRDFFLRRRKAIPLYKVWNKIMKRYSNGPMIFRHTDGQLWIYDSHLSELKVIEGGSINIPKYIRRSPIEKDERYFDGICMMCHKSPIQIRHINIYLHGSEGMFICRECELGYLLPFIRDHSYKSIKSKRAKFLAEKKSKKLETKIEMIGESYECR